ncbi:hypothetical protein Y032_0059g3009 [Ancylostoma ceylanicum]|uniref:Uncharacterized protein n=1 Tax=Ancylostoma ceylanicum TaxID=53326 RepID=A0A016U526_9BILA|nr:hypothetical protein Y032_0059g3009 [Ancylostoma ceylanicum]
MIVDLRSIVNMPSHILFRARTQFSWICATKSRRSGRSDQCRRSVFSFLNDENHQIQSKSSLKEWRYGASTAPFMDLNLFNVLYSKLI